MLKFLVLLCLVLVTTQACVPNAGVHTVYDLTFDDIDTSINPVVPAPLTYKYLVFHPSWQIIRNNTGNLPFSNNHTSTSLYNTNVLSTPVEFQTATPEFGTLCSNDTFDLLSLWMIGCFVNPRYFATDEACNVTFTGTKADNSIVTWKRPIRKTTMEIVNFATSRGFTGLKKLRVGAVFEFGDGSQAGRIALDDVRIARQNGKVTCPS